MLWAALSLPPDDPLRVMAEWDPLNTCPRAGGATVQQHARGAVFSSAALKYVAGLSGDQARPGGGAHPGCARAAGERRRCPEPEDDSRRVHLAAAPGPQLTNALSATINPYPGGTAAPSQPWSAATSSTGDCRATALAPTMARLDSQQQQHSYQC